MPQPSWRVAVAGFDHMHAGDQIALALAHPRAELVGIWDPDPAKVDPVADDLGVDRALRFADLDTLLGEARPDIVIVCSTTQDHLALVQRLAREDIHIVLEKPFAVSIEAADAMIKAVADAPGERRTPTLSVNWPLAWYPPHRTTKRLIDEGLIGDVLEVHYYNGNRGPLNHVHGKAEADQLAAKNDSWWYSAEAGGGSLLDYLGYGTTLATWYRDGVLPTAVTAQAWGPPGLAVDEQSVVIARYATGLSVFQTKWGSFTDPWTIQGQPKHGFVVVGSRGTIMSLDYAAEIHVQTADEPSPAAVPVDVLQPEDQSALAYLISRLEQDLPIEGPTSWQISRGGQLIVDAARESVRTGAEVALTDGQATA